MTDTSPERMAEIREIVTGPDPIFPTTAYELGVDLLAKVVELEARLTAKDKGIAKLEALVKQYADGLTLRFD